MPRSKALIIGINYAGSEHELGGCINDAMNVREFLVNERGFSDGSQDMIIMTDAPENQDTALWPNGANLMAAFKWLTSQNQEGDSVWLSYSGHGGQVAVQSEERSTGQAPPVPCEEARLTGTASTTPSVLSTFRKTGRSQARP